MYVLGINYLSESSVCLFKDNKRVYNILSEYKKITGNGVLINTSFNMHEEPIVCSVEDSYRAFAYSKLDYLIIDDEVFTLEK
tara:strand:- start:62 stop:307 length:246 start_codon:yes stop_codon:yes gene_type:complete